MTGQGAGKSVLTYDSVAGETYKKTHRNDQDYKIKEDQPEHERILIKAPHKKGNV